MISNKYTGFFLAFFIVMMISLSTSIGAMTSDTSYLEQTPTKMVEPAQTTQSLGFTIGSWDSRIVECAYSASHLNTRFTYRITFTVSGGPLEFFICSTSEATLWDQGNPIWIDSADDWPSTEGVTVTRSYRSNVALAFVFNNEHGDARTVSGSITVDTSGPSIMTNLVNNETYSEVFTITANATDSFTDVDSMAIYVDGNEKEDSTGGTIEYAWNTRYSGNGNVSISIIAVDHYGLSTNLTYVVWVENQGLGLSLPNLGLIAAGGVAIVIVVIYWFKNMR